MLTLLLHLVESNPAAPSIREVFLRVPSLFNLLDLALTLGIIWVLWRQRAHLFTWGGDEVSPRQYERLTGRLDGLERNLVENITHADARFDQIELAIGRRAAEDMTFRREIIQAEDKHLQAMKSIQSHLEGLVRRMEYNNRMLEQVQCVRENGTVGDCVKDEKGKK
jgi:hypothetical protein